MIEFEGRADPSKETVIRLRVGYRSVQSLVKEYTASLGRGGCLLVTRKAVAPGARFVFEMTCDEVGELLVVEGEVVRVRLVNAAQEAYELAVRYCSSPATQAVLDVMLASIGVDSSYPVVRAAPRIPVNLPADDSVGQSRYVVRDVSRGGARVECTLGACRVNPEDRVLLGVSPRSSAKIFVGGTVRWVGHPAQEGELQFGIQFDELRSADDPRRLAIDSLTRFERPQQLLVHVVGDKSRQSTLSRDVERRRPELAEVRSAVATLVKQGPLERCGLQVVDSSVDHLLEDFACTARVAMQGDFAGELQIHATPPLCAVVAGQITGDLTPNLDSTSLHDALGELAVRLAGALCDSLERSGFEITPSAPLVDPPPSPVPSAWVHSVALAGRAGLATLKVVAYQSPSPSPPPPDQDLWSALLAKRTAM
ncbi:MAG: PilZ domain-containing protein [Kofleriaceae bacterium]